MIESKLVREHLRALRTLRKKQDARTRELDKAACVAEKLEEELDLITNVTISGYSVEINVDLRKLNDVSIVLKKLADLGYHGKKGAQARVIGSSFVSWELGDIMILGWLHVNGSCKFVKVGEKAFKEEVYEVQCDNGGEE